jgi:hypothetical protein
VTVNPFWGSLSIPETKEARVTVNTQYDPDVGRPKKQPGEHYRTPARSWKPPPELYERLKAATAWKGETVTNVLVRKATEYVEQVEREQGRGLGADEPTTTNRKA